MAVRTPTRCDPPRSPAVGALAMSVLLSRVATPTVYDLLAKHKDSSGFDEAGEVLG